MSTASTLPTDAKSLIALYDAHVAAVDAMQGAACQPRADDVEELLWSEMDRLSDKAGKVAQLLAAMQVVDWVDKDERARVLVDRAFRCGEGQWRSWPAPLRPGRRPLLLGAAR